MTHEWFCKILQKCRTIDHSLTDWFYLLLITFHICQVRLYYDINHNFKKTKYTLKKCKTKPVLREDGLGKLT